MVPDVHTAVQGPLPEAGWRADSRSDREAYGPVALPAAAAAAAAAGAAAASAVRGCWAGAAAAGAAAACRSRGSTAWCMRVERAALDGVITDEQQTQACMQAVFGVPCVALAAAVHPGSWCCATSAVSV